jgi:hypothetical protein
MFKAITFATQNKLDPNAPLDIGCLVESMLFYQQATVIADKSILKQLIQYLGIERLITLIDEGLLKIKYTESLVGVFTNTINNTQYHDTVEISSPKLTFQDEIRKLCIDVTGRSGKGRRLAQKIENKIQVLKHDHVILEGARYSILDQAYIDPAVKLIIKQLCPEVVDVSGLQFNTFMTANGIVVDTNINFDELNRLYHKSVSPSHSTLTSAHFLTHILDTERELYFAATGLSELASSQLSADLASQKIDYIIDKSRKSSSTLSNFNTFVFNDSKAIREAVNSEKIDLDDLLEVLIKSKKFKEWIAGLKPEEDLIKSYYKEVTKETIVDKLPVKSVRLSLFTGLGFAVDAFVPGGIGTAAGIALGVLDTFYLDRMILGWKPNQFIDNEVKRLISNGI